RNGFCALPVRTGRRKRHQADDADREPDVWLPRGGCPGVITRAAAGAVMKFYEDIEIGELAEIGRHTFTAEEIKRFAARFDPQPFHLDEAAAERSHFGRLCASGWHSACIWMRLVIEHRRREDEGGRARGEPVALLGVSPGFRDLQWSKPVHVGDTISYATKVIDKRPSLSRPQWGIVTARNTGTDQNGVLVLSFVNSAFVERRHAREAG